MKSQYAEITKKLKEADAILIGASNGLSITEGLHLFADNQAFDDLFGDLKEKYGLRCLLHGMGAQWPTEEERWGFWSRLVHNYCAGYRPTAVMKDLMTLTGDKDYFIVTSNGECHFEMSGFDPDKIYEVEGTWLGIQCSKPCHRTVYPALEMFEEMAAVEKNGIVPSELIPRCPECGAPMTVNMEGGPNFIHDDAANMRLQRFLAEYHGKKLVVLELGIGWRNQLIKAPLMRLVAGEPNASYITINLGEVFITDDIKEKSFGIDGPLSDVLSDLRAEYESQA